MKKMKKPKKLTKAKIKKLEKREIKKQFLEWSKKVKERDNAQCIICKATKFLHTHHLLPREIKDFRFDVDNGVTLCAKHHKFSLENSPHRNPLVFMLWLELNRLEQLIALRAKLIESSSLIRKNKK